MTPFADVYRDLHRPLRRWVERRFGPDLADDVVQETFLQLHRNWSKASGVENMRRWLFGVAKYVGGHMLRAAQAGKRGGDLVVEWSVEAERRASDEPPQGAALYVEQLRGHFSGLGPAQRLALTGLASGLTISEVAEQQGCSVASASAALNLGRKRLREKLGDVAPAVWA